MAVSPCWNLESVAIVMFRGGDGRVLTLKYDRATWTFLKTIGLVTYEQGVKELSDY